MSNNQENIEKLETALGNLKTKESVIYFLVYDTKNNARASVKHIYDMALTLKNNGYISKILVEEKDYSGVSWLGDTYKDIPVCLLYTSPSPRDRQKSRMPSSA